MKFSSIIYVLLVFSFLTMTALSIYYYLQIQQDKVKISQAVSSGTPLPDYHFALIGEELDHDYWRLVGKGAKQNETEYDVFVEYEGPERSNPEEQLKLLDKAIKKKVDGIIVQALNDEFTPLIDLAVGKGIPVITIDTDSPDSLRSAYIGTDNYAAGQLAGKALIEDTGGEAVVGIVTGRFNNTHHSLRVEGFRDVIEQEAGIDIVAIEESNIDRIGAEEKAHNMLTEHKEITALYGTSALDGTGISEAAESLDRQDLYVITFDTLEENLRLLEKGKVDALVEQQPWKMGHQSVKIMTDLINEKQVKKIHHTNSSIVRKQNLPYRQDLRGGRQ
ncbi:monosaccharide ABC transporter substrate-binding protein, CUT2 family [Halobacillus karajensis]|uniref:D-allose-binding periplasmic protein n=1 Tax=Halobacillus karajensis TaxID=195088 RepID=A0A024P9R2_9BACI|nr:sugar-binding protein [Halobacillus karajensis]CDQ21260.1 D-allose-binding periplasmic protein precursor [Halobacillus karajensis]CDQ25670.1 D-allose-binding periplasmic protein precursor [Halobacillus karajensis]CDQ25941.1 D-allose-binding periplasmic protein precursor [Halobacillus karajensis]SEI10148.1 monosaccharide ABC transporter substrate-binding protein, CUT2 family [Halobacillus karajensis]